MRTPLKKFTTFANTLLPHETQYLLTVQQFKDVVRLQILEQINRNCNNIARFEPYDSTIDKRKYNHLQNWIQTRLDQVDIDTHYKWMLEMEQKIATDSILPQEEKKLLKKIRDYDALGFYFMKFYNLLRIYRDFLLIRMRYRDYTAVSNFLESYAERYQNSKAIQERIHAATVDITYQYSGKGRESKQWEDWLTSVFYDEQIDGQSRYHAFLRLTFISVNYRRFDMLREKFDFLGQKFLQGQFYSKRLLLNYYNNRLLLHARFREYDQAVYYGYLSIRSPNHDYIHYVNNLSAVLLRQDKHQEALELMKGASATVKTTKNFHSRVGFVAFYMEALIKAKHFKNAESYGDSFLHAYTKEVLQHRWHLFFSIYLLAMLKQGHYEKIFKTVRKYKLQEKDRNYAQQAAYLPTIPLFVAIAQYKDGIISDKDLAAQLEQAKAQYNQQNKRPSGFKNLFKEIAVLVPKFFLTAH